MDNKSKILLDAIRQIKILNANKDRDIEWLCIEAIKLILSAELREGGGK